MKVKVGENATDLVIRLIDDKYIVIVGMDKYDALRGGGPIAVCNDEKSYSAPAGFREVIDPAIADKQSATLDLFTPKGRNHAYRDWLEGQGGTRSSDTKSWSIPTEHVGTVKRSELDQYKPGGRKAMTQDLYDQEWRGLFTSFQGLIFPDFIDRTWPEGHILPWQMWNAIRRQCEVFGSLDWGFADNTVLHWWARTANNKLILFDELVVNIKTPRQVVRDAMAKRPLPEPVYADPSIFHEKGDGAQSIGWQFIDAGLKVTPANNSFGPSINHIRSLMYLPDDDDELPQFTVVEGMCPQGVSNLSTLGDEDVKETGGGFREGVDCHPADSIRYGAMSIYVDDGKSHGRYSADDETDFTQHKSGLWVPRNMREAAEPQLDSLTGAPMEGFDG